MKKTLAMLIAVLMLFSMTATMLVSADELPAENTAEPEQTEKKDPSVQNQAVERIAGSAYSELAIEDAAAAFQNDPALLPEAYTYYMLLNEEDASYFMSLLTEEYQQSIISYKNDEEIRLAQLEMEAELALIEQEIALAEAEAAAEAALAAAEVAALAEAEAAEAAALAEAELAGAETAIEEPEKIAEEESTDTEDQPSAEEISTPGENETEQTDDASAQDPEQSEDSVSEECQEDQDISGNQEEVSTEKSEESTETDKTEAVTEDGTTETDEEPAAPEEEKAGSEDETAETEDEKTEAEDEKSESEDEKAETEEEKNQQESAEESGTVNTVSSSVMKNDGNGALTLNVDYTIEREENETYLLELRLVKKAEAEIASTDPAEAQLAEDQDYSSTIQTEDTILIAENDNVSETQIERGDNQLSESNSDITANSDQPETKETVSEETVTDSAGADVEEVSSEYSATEATESVAETVADTEETVAEFELLAPEIVVNDFLEDASDSMEITAGDLTPGATYSYQVLVRNAAGAVLCCDAIREVTVFQEEVCTVLLSQFLADCDQSVITITDTDIVADADFTINETQVFVIESGSLTIPAGITLNNNGLLVISGGKLIIDSGAAFICSAFAQVTGDGQIVLNENTVFDNNGTGVLSVDASNEGSSAAIEGIPTGFIDMNVLAATEEELAAWLACGDYRFITIYVTDPSMIDLVSADALALGKAVSLK